MIPHYFLDIRPDGLFSLDRTDDTGIRIKNAFHQHGTAA